MTDIEDSISMAAESSARSEANIPTVTYNIFNRYNPNFKGLLKKGFKSDRTYEDEQTYYVVFKPYLRYEGTDDLLRIEKCCRQHFKYKRILVTREINASSIHYNVLITSNTCPVAKHNRTLARDFRLHCQNVSTVKDINQVIDYMAKEADTREMVPKKDSFIYIKE